MSIDDLDKSLLKQALKASEGFPSQTSKARLVKGKLSPSRAGHSLASHVQGSSGISFKTKFHKSADMVDAMWRLLNTSAGKKALRSLKVGSRTKLAGDVGRVYNVNFDLSKAKLGKVTFRAADMRAAGVSKTRCIAILELRSRGDREHLHVQTFYPTFTDVEITKLLDVKTA